MFFLLYLSFESPVNDTYDVYGEKNDGFVYYKVGEYYPEERSNETALKKNAISKGLSQATSAGYISLSKYDTNKNYFLEVIDKGFHVLLFQENEVIIIILFPGTDMATCSYNSSTCHQEVWNKRQYWGYNKTTVPSK